MLLYKDARNQYLAVPAELGFLPVNGYRSCFEGRDVPDVICAAFIRESGGQMVARPAVAA